MASEIHSEETSRQASGSLYYRKRDLPDTGYDTKQDKRYNII